VRLPVEEVDLVLPLADEHFGVHVCFEIGGGYGLEDKILNPEGHDLFPANA